MKDLINKKVLISPYTPLTKSLKINLENKDIKFLGFIDKNNNDKVYSISEINDLVFDYILILSPNHYFDIYTNYLNFVEADKLINVNLKNAKYTFSREFLKKREINFLPSDYKGKRNKVVFISKDFISSNNKALFLYCNKFSIETSMLTDNVQQILEFKNYKINCLLLGTDKSDKEIAEAKLIIFDQANYTYLPSLEPEQKTIQLWHGVGLKKMNKLTNIKYDYFISTSHWTNETNFKNIFLSKNYLSTGYPRNDIFFKNEEKEDLILCDKEIFKILKSSQYNKCILYCPTHRENNIRIPLDFEALDKELEKNNSILVVKFHPFVLKFYNQDITNKYTNILIYNPNNDIYPLLKYFDVLVSDYSSIIYDFLLLNKPIISFAYDLEDYVKNVELLFNYKDYTPGEIVKTQKELIDSIFKNDLYEEKRTKIRKLFFDTNEQSACKNILDIILENVEEK